MSTEVAPDLHTLKIGALLNSSSGSCDVGAEHELEAILREQGLAPTQVWCGGGSEIAGALKESATRAIDLLIVLGGDGTIRSAAESCSEAGPLLMPLPGGTMNMLPKAIYGERSWQAALRDTLAEPVVQPVVGGQVDEHRFFVAAIVGNPSLWGEAREAVREGNLAEAVGKGGEALKRAFSTSLKYDHDGVSGTAEAVSILCPLTSAAMGDEDVALEFAAIDPHGATGVIELAFHSLVHGWRNAPNVETAKTRHVQLRSQQPLPAILDGETVELGADAAVEILPVAFRALRPA